MPYCRCEHEGAGCVGGRWQSQETLCERGCVDSFTNFPKQQQLREVLVTGSGCRCTAVIGSERDGAQKLWLYKRVFFFEASGLRQVIMILRMEGTTGLDTHTHSHIKIHKLYIYIYIYVAGNFQLHWGLPRPQTISYQPKGSYF